MLCKKQNIFSSHLVTQRFPHANKIRIGSAAAKLLPSSASTPVSVFRRKTLIRFESWFATSIQLSVGSSTKLRGVLPPQLLRAMGVSLPLSYSARKLYRKLLSRLAK